jgi:hypothetical protein
MVSMLWLRWCIVLPALFIDLSKAFDTADHSSLLSNWSEVKPWHWCLFCGFTIILVTEPRPLWWTGVQLKCLTLYPRVRFWDHCCSHCLTMTLEILLTPVTLISTQMSQIFIPVPHQQAICHFYTIPKSLTDLKLVLNANCCSLGLVMLTLRTGYLHSKWSLNWSSFFGNTHWTFSKEAEIYDCFLNWNKSCLSSENIRKIVQIRLLPVIDYGDIIYIHAAASVLKPLDSVFHSAICFTTGTV